MRNFTNVSNKYTNNTFIDEQTGFLVDYEVRGYTNFTTVFYQIVAKSTNF